MMRFLVWWIKGEQWISFMLNLVSVLIVTHKILIDELMKYRLGNWMLRCTDNWLNCQV